MIPEVNQAIRRNAGTSSTIKARDPNHTTSPVKDPPVRRTEADPFLCSPAPTAEEEEDSREEQMCT